MADVAHTVPTAVAYLDGSDFGLTRPGIQVTPFISGRVLTRDWHGHNLMQYELSPALFNSTDDTLEEWEAFWHQIDGGATAGWIVDPISATHRDLLCGVLGDASQTTFPLPVVSPSSTTVLKDGAPFLSALTVHTEANLHTDDKYAAPQTIGDWQSAQATTIEIDSAVSCDGLNSIRVTPNGSTTECGVFPDTAGHGACVVGDDYTALVAVLDASGRDFRVGLRYLDSVPSLLSFQWSLTTAATVGEWTIYSVTNTAPASAAYVAAIVQETANANSNKFYVDAFGVAYGDYDRWHLPSVSPGLIEYDSAPAAGVRTTATATGKRVTRCRFEPGTRWSMSSPGHAAVRSIRATEWPEF